MQNDIPRRAEEEELEEGVQNLLDHLVVFLLRSKQVLQQFDQIRGSNGLSDLIVPAYSSYEHHALQHDIVFSCSVE